MLMKVVSLLSAAPTQNVCTPVSCTETSVYLNSTTANRRDSPYACRGEQLVFHCEVVNGAGIQWASEPDISCKDPLSFTTYNSDGDHKERLFYQSYLVSVARDPPSSNFTSNLTFTPPPSVNSVTVVCGNQLPFCTSTAAEFTLSITGKCCYSNMYLLLPHTHWPHTQAPCGHGEKSLVSTIHVCIELSTAEHEFKQ